MPDPRDFLPQLPWEGPPVPRKRRKGFLLETPADLYSKIVASFIKSEQLIEEAWADSSMTKVLEFYEEKLVYDVERQIAFLQSFRRAIHKQLGK